MFHLVHWKLSLQPFVQLYNFYKHSVYIQKYIVSRIVIIMHIVLYLIIDEFLHYICIMFHNVVSIPLRNFLSKTPKLYRACTRVNSNCLKFPAGSFLENAPH